MLHSVYRVEFPPAGECPRRAVGVTGETLEPARGGVAALASVSRSYGANGRDGRLTRLPKISAARRSDSLTQAA